MVLLLLSACRQDETEGITPTLGAWHFRLMPEGKPELPFTAVLEKGEDGYSFTVQNANEEIEIKEVLLSGNALRMRVPVFESVFEGKLRNSEAWEGVWQDPSRNTPGNTYQIRFEAKQSDAPRFANLYSDIQLDSVYETTFSPGLEGEYPAIGIFKQQGAKVVGTFITETGDYRYLEGGLRGDSLLLSGFDGSHAYLFQARVKGNGDLEGNFYSGNHWSEPWVATPNPEVKLAEPDQMNYIKEGYDGISFSFPNVEGDTVNYPSQAYEGKVVLMQLLGSWCPNCMDETRLFARWHKAYHDRGLEIIGLAFERQPQVAQAFEAIQYMKKSLDVDYEILLASNSTSKTTAGEKLPMLNKVIAYPTSIFIDKDGTIRAIHTGFNGPATGRLYDEYVAKYEKLITTMLEE